MSYVSKHLSRGEEIVYASRQHWFAVVARMGVWILVSIVAVAIAIWIGTNETILGNATVDGAITVVVMVALVATVAYLAFVIWDWRNQEWVITSQRVIRAEGVLNKSVSDSNLEKINDARLDQSMFGRMFGFGTLDILTAAEEAGGSNIADFPMIADPVAFKKAMFDQKQMIERPDLAPPRYQQSAPPPDMVPAEPMPPRAGSDQVAVAPAAAASVASPPSVEAPPTPPADDVSAKLESLAGLRDKGLITPEEYEAKKSDLLERL